MLRNVTTLLMLLLAGLQTMSAHLKIIIDPIVPILSIGLIPEDDGNANFTTTDYLRNVKWTLQVYNVNNSMKIAEQAVVGSYTSIDTTKWSDGLYIIKAIVNGLSVSKSIHIKK